MWKGKISHRGTRESNEGEMMAQIGNLASLGEIVMDEIVHKCMKGIMSVEVVTQVTSSILVIHCIPFTIGHGLRRLNRDRRLRPKRLRPNFRVKPPFKRSMYKSQVI